MTPDELRSNIVRGAVGLLGYAAGRYHFSTETIGLITSDIGYAGSVAAFAYGGYLHWGMKKVAADAIVSATRTVGANTTGLAVLLALAAALALGAGEARAADRAPLTKANPLVAYTQGKCGGYLGLNTFGDATALQGGPVGAQIVQGDIGATFGYGCPIGTTPGNFWFAELNLDWANINGNTAGLGITGPFHGEARVALGSPISSVLGALPGNPFANLSTPAAPLCPATVTCGNQYPFLFGALHVQDIGGQFGLAQHREFLWFPGIGIGLESRWSNAIVNDVWVQLTMQSTGLALGPMKVNLGNGATAGTTFKF